MSSDSSLQNLFTCPHAAEMKFSLESSVMCNVLSRETPLIIVSVDTRISVDMQYNSRE